MEEQDQYMAAMEDLHENTEAAISALEKLTENGFGKAMLALALVYDPANEVEYTAQKDAEKSEKYYKNAFNVFLEKASLGDGDAMFSLSNCYATGWGTEISIDKAQEWKQKSCKAGYETACKEISANGL